MAPVLEVRGPPTGHVVLVGDRIAGRAGLPAGGRPLRPDRPVHLVRPGGRGPVAAGALALVADPADAVRGGRLVGDRIAGRAGLPAGGRPLRPDRPVHLVRPGGRGPVDAGAVAEVVEPADAVRVG